MAGDNFMITENQPEAKPMSDDDIFDLFEPADQGVAEALNARKKADELRDAAIARLCAQIEQAQRSLKALGYDGAVHVNGNGLKHTKPATPAVSSPVERKKRFANMKFADVGRTILQEYGPQHGSEIERIAKAGGFKTNNKTFQAYLRIAFEREGGFENTGQNNWKLNDQIQPKLPAKGSVD